MFDLFNNLSMTLAQPLGDGASEMHLQPPGLDATGRQTVINRLRLTIEGLENGETVREIVETYLPDSSTSFQIARGLEGTTIRNWPEGTRVEARLTAGMMGSYLQRDPSSGRIAMDESGALQQGWRTDMPGVVFPMGNGFARTRQAGWNYSFVVGGRASLDKQIQLSGYEVLPLVTSGHTDQDLNVVRELVFGTRPVDVGQPQAWAEGLYGRASVVAPPTPDGNQYWADVDQDEDSFYDSGPWNPSEYHSWGQWKAQPMPVQLERAFDYPMVVTEVGFITMKSSASAPPVVSIGDQDSPTRFASQVSLAGAQNERHVSRISLTQSGQVAQSVKFRVDTPAAGGFCRGRFYVRGFFIEFPM